MERYLEVAIERLSIDSDHPFAREYGAQHRTGLSFSSGVHSSVILDFLILLLAYLLIIIEVHLKGPVGTFVFNNIFRILLNRG